MQKLRKIEYETVINDVDPKGNYRFKIVFWIVLASLLENANRGDYVFITRSPPYRCKISVCDDDKYDQTWLKNVSFSKDGCLTSTVLNTSNSYSSNSCPAEWFDNTVLKSCDEYVFKEPGSFVEEMGIECQTWMVTLVGSFNYIGLLLGMPVFGFLSDKYGRKNLILYSCVLGSIFAMGKSLAINYEMFMTFQLLQSFVCTGTHHTIFILGIETVPTKYRALLGTTISPLTMGIAILLEVSIAYGFPYWRSFVRIIYALYFLPIISYWTVDESSRWLISKRHYKRFEKAMIKIANANGIKLSPSIEDDLKFNIEYGSNVKEQDVKTKEKSVFLQALKSKDLMLQFLISCFLFLILEFCSRGVFVLTGELSGNLYVNYALTTITSISGGSIGFLVLNKFGRKIITSLSFACAAIFFICFIFIPKETLGSFIVYLIATIFVGFTFIVTTFYIMELFPTALRNTLISFCSMFGKMGSALGPQVILLEKVFEDLSIIIFASVCIISALLTITLPETANKNLQDTINEVNTSEETSKD